ncbi:MAG: hypothetical protein HGA80_00085 [Candidatus Omnitrophica bacterium]|nr:hypothetical protein [Candidatus Omnitrophota bacterium]
MAKRKSNQPQLSADLLIGIGLIIIVLFSFVALAWGCVAYLTRSGLFTVREVVVSDSLGGIDIPELSKLKGHNIFNVRLEKLEARLHGKYPALSNLKAVRRFPDEIVVTAVRREPFARAALNGRVVLVDREGYLLGAAGTTDEPLPLLKGLRTDKIVPGTQLTDQHFALASGIVSVFRGNRTLADIVLRSVDVSDTVRIVCLLGAEAGAAGDGVEVIVDSKSFTSRVSELGLLLSHRQLDLAGVKYIDLRFGAPIIGQKKQGKQ